MSDATFFARSPVWALIGPGLAYAAIWIFAPINFVYSGGLQSMLIAASMPTLLLMGMIIGYRRINGKIRTVRINKTRLQRTIHLIAYCGIFGLALRLFERIFLRGGGVVATDFMANRESLSSGGSGFISLIGGTLAALLMFLPFFCFLWKKIEPARSKMATVFLWTSLALPISDVVLQGSRSTLIVYLGIFLSSWLSLNQFKLKPRIAIFSFLSTIALVWLGGAVFILRTTQMGIDPVSSMYTSGYAYFAPPSAATLELLEHNEITGFISLLYSLVHLFQYLTHGLHEFFFITSQVSSPTTYGLQSLYIPAKIFLTLTGDPDIESVIVSGQLRSGVYTTLFGPLIYDFGPWGAALVCFCMGIGIGLIARRIGRGRLILLPLHLVIIGFLPFSLVVNLFVSGNGQFVLISSICLVLILSIRRFRPMEKYQPPGSH